jgi:hypothetical protein
MNRPIVFALLCAACIPSTGGKRVQFQATANGLAEAAAFDTPSGYAVSLTRAQLFVGALYFNQTNPANYNQSPACILPGIYSGEVRGGLSVDALNPALQQFPVAGNGDTWPTHVAELWLTDADVNDTDSTRVVIDVAGTATKGADSFPFEGQLTIGSNRDTPPKNPALPGSSPICKQRIVTPIPAELTLGEGGTVRLTVDARRWFDSVDFSALTQAQASPLVYRFIDSTVQGGQPDVALYNAARAASDQTYRFEWDAAP